MKKFGIALGSIAITLNILIAAMGGLAPGETLTDDTRDGGEFELSDATTVTVPPLKSGDMVTYDSRIYAVWYGENTSSGEFNKVEIIALGTTSIRISSVKNVKDGFFQTHPTISKEIITRGRVDLVYTNNTSTFTITGSMDMDRAEHWDLATVMPIAISNKGDMRLSGLGALTGSPGGVGEMKFSGDLRSWPDLTKDYVLTLEEQIFGMGQILSLGDSGMVQQPNEMAQEWAIPYTWVAEQGLSIHGHETVKINVTSAIWEVVPYFKHIWIANDMSMPAKVYDRANYSGEYPDYNYSEYIILENERTIQEGGFTRGGQEIPWTGVLGETAPPGHYKDVNPYGEYKPWYSNRLPVGGSNFVSSSFDMSTEEAMEFALDNSPGLREFIQSYPDTTIRWGRYNATKDILDQDGKVGIYYWNLSLGHKPTQAELDAYYEHGRSTGEWYAPWRYRITIKKEVVNDGTILNPVYRTIMTLDNETLHERAANSKNMYDYGATTLTMTGVENIMKQDSAVLTKCFDSDGRLIWNSQRNDEYIRFAISTGDDGGEAFQDLISMILGINMPVFDFVWSYTKGWVGEDGETFEVDINAENGQLLGVLYAEGTAFMSLFQ